MQTKLANIQSDSVVVILNLNLILILIGRVLVIPPARDPPAS